MRSLLFLTQRIPYPPNKGDKLRAFNILRRLSRSWAVHLGCFVDDPADWQYVDVLRHICADVHCVPLDKRWAKLRSLKGLATGAALSIPYFSDARLSRWVGGVLADVKPSAAFLFSSVMAQYVPAGGALRPPRVVMDFVDVDSDKWRQYAARQPWPASWIYGRESRRLLEFDRAVAACVDAGIFVTASEAALFGRLAPEVARRIHDISNGIDQDYFDPQAAYPNPYPGSCRPIVFTGAMDYWPNIDAVTWFARESLPQIRARIPDAAFYIVGSNPAPAVKELAASQGVIVTGWVPDTRPYLRHAALAVAPMRVARGIQNKVLEAMAMGRPVITSDSGLEGIEAVPGRDLLVAEGPADFAELAIRVLADPQMAKIGLAASYRIREGYAWDDKLAAFERLLEGDAMPLSTPISAGPLPDLPDDPRP